MSVRVTSYAIVGVKIDATKLSKIAKVRGCDCKIDVEKGEKPKFCPNCGAKFSYQDREFVKEVTERDLGGHLFLNKYEIIFPVHEIDYVNQKEAYIVLKGVDDSEYTKNDENFIQLPDLNKAKEEFKNDIGPFGLWDEKKFGLWAVVYWS